MTELACDSGSFQVIGQPAAFQVGASIFGAGKSTIINPEVSGLSVSPELSGSTVSSETTGLRVAEEMTGTDANKARKGGDDPASYWMYGNGEWILLGSGSEIDL